MCGLRNVNVLIKKAWTC